MVDVRVELFYSGTWNNITTDVRVADPITIKRGRSDESSVVQPSTLSLTLHDPTGKFNSRNPRSALFGLIGRNTPIRVFIGLIARFTGEVSAWPPEWDLSGTDVRVPIEAAGIMRRLEQGKKPGRSALYRGFTDSSLAAPIAYWPLEDREAADSLASALAGHEPMKMELKKKFGEVAPSIDIGAYDDLASSEPLPTFEEARLSGTIPPYTLTSFLRMFVVLQVRSGEQSAKELIRLRLSGGSVRQVLVRPETPDPPFTPNVAVTFLDEDGNIIRFTGFKDIGVQLDGLPQIIELSLTQSGNNIDMRLTGHRLDGVATDYTETLVGHTFRTARLIQLANTVIAGTTNSWNKAPMGHLCVVAHNDANLDVMALLQAHDGETAVARMLRIANEEGLLIPITGTPALTELVGPQRPLPMLDQLRVTADVDMGALGERLDQLTMTYRARHTFENQTPALTLDYASGQVAEPFLPVEDDQNTRNDVTVKRTGGSEWRATLQEGPLSTQAPPNGVGLYTHTPEVNCHSDGQQLRDQTGWRLHLGTVDEARFPQVRVDLASPDLALLVDTVLGVEVGDLIRVTNPPDWLPPGPLDMIVQAVEERIEDPRHDVVFTCTPGPPWIVGVIGQTKADTLTCETTASFVSGTDTSLAVNTTGGPRWTTDAAQYPFELEVAGVVLNATACTGATSAQTFTVDAAPVNGIAKTIPVGSPLRLGKRHRAVVAL